MQKIESITEEQWAKIELIRQKWIDNASYQPTDEEIKEAVYSLYSLHKPIETVTKDTPISEIIELKSKKPEVIIVESPLAAGLLVTALRSKNDSLRDSLRDSLWNSLGHSLRDSLRDSLMNSLWDSLWDSLGNSLENSLWDSLGDSLWNYVNNLYWQKSYAGFIEGGLIAGVNYDKDKYDKHQYICHTLSFIMPFKTICIVARNPTKVHWQEGILHSETESAVEYADGFKIYAIEGITVPEKVVLNPQDQTLYELNNEQNEEVKRIRINRYGWHQYLEDSKAKVLDVSLPNGGAWMESLMDCGDYRVLCTYDPSTGHPYALEVSKDCQTCKQAQRYLLAPEIAYNGIIKDVSKISTYPIIRS